MFNTALSLLMVSAPPTPEMVRSVFDHFYNGADVVLAEVLLCKDVEVEDKSRKYDCNEVWASEAPKGAKVNVHISALVPREQTAELTIQALLNGEVRATKDAELKGNRYSPRIRVFRGFVASKPGDWTFVVREGDKILKKLTLAVSE